MERKFNLKRLALDHFIRPYKRYDLSLTNSLDRMYRKYKKSPCTFVLPTIVHSEIPSDDIERAKKFYNDLFGRKIEKWAGTDKSQLTSAATGQPMEYWMMTTTDDKGNKALCGGMMKRVQPEQQTTNYINVRSVDEYSEKVEKLGGRVVAPKHAVPGMGYFAICLDTENNCFAIWESNETAK